MQVLADFAAERASVVSAATAQVNAAGSEVEALRRLLRLKGRELQQLRHLAQEVLLQRSEVEIFLLSSLHQVHHDTGRYLCSLLVHQQLPGPCHIANASAVQACDLKTIHGGSHLLIEGSGYTARPA